MSIFWLIISVSLYSSSPLFLFLLLLRLQFLLVFHPFILSFPKAQRGRCVENCGKYWGLYSCHRHGLQFISIIFSIPLENDRNWWFSEGNVTVNWTHLLFVWNIYSISTCCHFLFFISSQKFRILFFSQPWTAIKNESILCL